MHQNKTPTISSFVTPMSSESTSTRRAKVPLPGIAKTAYDLRNPRPQKDELRIPQLPQLPQIPQLRPTRQDAFMGRGTPPRGPPKQSLPVRTSKLTQKHVFLPGDIQTRPLPYEEGRRPPTAYEQQQQEEVEARFRMAERMGKEERESEGYNRLTAYAVGERYKMKSLAAFSKREHNAWARQYDEAIYTVYHLPLLPGYSATTSLRSSAPLVSPGGGSIIDQYEEADEMPQHAEIEQNEQQQYDDISHSPPRIDDDGFIKEGGGVEDSSNVSPSADDVAVHADMKSAPSYKSQKSRRRLKRQLESVNDTVAEVIHFDYVGCGMLEVTLADVRIGRVCILQYDRNAREGYNPGYGECGGSSSSTAAREQGDRAVSLWPR